MLKTISFKTFWKDSSIILKLFTGFTLYSFIESIWNMVSNSEYLNNLQPFGIEGNLLINILVVFIGLLSSFIFLLAVFTKNRLLFYIHLYSGIIIVPAVFFISWINMGRGQAEGIVFIFALLFISLFFFLIYQQRHYFSK